MPDLINSRMNGFRGNVLQEAASVCTVTDQNCYQLETKCFSVYGFEYKPGFDDAVSELTGYVNRV